MSKILITGHQGLVGQACHRHFSSLGHQIIVDKRREIDLKDKLATLDFFQTHSPEIIIHCAAKVGGVADNQQHPVEFYLDNTQIQNSVFQAAYLSGVKKMVNLATSCMFPHNAVVPVCEESLMHGPFNPSVQSYATAKLGGYNLCLSYHKQYGANFMTGCPANVFGLGDKYDPLKSHVVPALIMKFHQAMKSGGDVEVWGDGSAVRELIFADDLARAIEVMLDKWNRPELINLGTGVSTSIRELVNELIRVTGFQGNIRYNTEKPTGIDRKTFNIDKITSLGWKQQFPLSDALEMTWDDYCQRNSVPNGIL